MVLVGDVIRFYARGRGARGIGFFHGVFGLFFAFMAMTVFGGEFFFPMNLLFVVVGLGFSINGFRMVWQGRPTTLDVGRDGVVVKRSPLRKELRWSELSGCGRVDRELIIGLKSGEELRVPLSEDDQAEQAATCINLALARSAEGLSMEDLDGLLSALREG